MNMAGLDRGRRKGNYLRALTEDEVERIHQGSMRMLEEIGVVVDHGEIQSLLEQAGCRIDHGSGLTKIPPKLVDEAVARAPSEVVLCGRDGQHDMRIGNGKVYARIPGGAPGILDLETRAWRPPLKRDVADIARVADGLDHINGVSMLPVVPTDVPIEIVDVHAAEAAFCHTSKHLFYVCHNAELINKVIDMAIAATGDDEALQRRPLLSALAEATAPLRLMEDQLRVLKVIVDLNFT